jgi:hypothetical protein
MAGGPSWLWLAAGRRSGDPLHGIPARCKREVRLRRPNVPLAQPWKTSWPILAGDDCHSGHEQQVHWRPLGRAGIMRPARGFAPPAEPLTTKNGPAVVCLCAQGPSVLCAARPGRSHVLAASINTHRGCEGCASVPWAQHQGRRVRSRRPPSILRKPAAGGYPGFDGSIIDVGAPARAGGGAVAARPSPAVAQLPDSDISLIPGGPSVNVNLLRSCGPVRVRHVGWPRARFEPGHAGPKPWPT